MYGNAKVAKYFGCFFLISAAGIELKGISVVLGASDSKTRFFFHCAWYFFSIAIRVSLFLVCFWSVSIQQRTRIGPTFSIFKVFAEL